MTNKIIIEDQIKRTVSFLALVDDMESPFACACQAADLSNWDEYCGYSYTFTIFADSKDEAEEKTLDLISDIENLAKNRVININFDNEVEVKGFDLEALKRRTQTHREIHTNYGREGKSLNAFVTESLQKNIFEFEDEETDVDMVLFYNTYEDCFGDFNDEEKKLYADDMKLNEEAVKYGLTEKVYGEFTILTRQFAEEYMNFEYDEDED